MTTEDQWHWIRTVGAPMPGDARDGELHQLFGELPGHFDLEPWDGDANDPDVRDARYFRVDRPPVLDEEGRLVWLYEFRSEADH